MPELQRPVLSLSFLVRLQTDRSTLDDSEVRPDRPTLHQVRPDRPTLHDSQVRPARQSV